MKLWICRVLIGLVLLDNLQAGILFLASPGGFAHAFDLSGAAGLIAIRSIGILFLMWCVPYAVASIHPIRYRVSLIEACIMQTIGLVGESVLFINLPGELENTPLSLGRFIVFDAAGLVLLLTALWLTAGIQSFKISHSART